MKIAVTGGTGFLGRYIISRLSESGHQIRAWYRPESPRGPANDLPGDIEWIPGDLTDPSSMDRLVESCDGVVHAALWRPGRGFRNAEGDVVEFARINIIGSLQLFEAARRADLSKTVFVSTCAVHEVILDDRPLDEAHPLWPLTHYGAHKAAIEKFVHSYGLGQGMDICAIRPTGIYGVAHPVQQSKWFDLVSRVVRGERVETSGGGKEVHAADVARGIEILLNADRVTAGQAYACYDRYISQFEVATLAKELSDSPAEIVGEPKRPKHEIVTEKIRRLGMTFGGEERLRSTIAELVHFVQNNDV